MSTTIKNINKKVKQKKVTCIAMKKTTLENFIIAMISRAPAEEDH
ncbi:MAG: hypothetical protein U9N35_05720 [Euryarchaeota archaeon]|nr:hypothetical protein [Euryarchaeota archaeon]